MEVLSVLVVLGVITLMAVIFKRDQREKREQQAHQQALALAKEDDFKQRRTYGEAMDLLRKGKTAEDAAKGLHLLGSLPVEVLMDSSRKSAFVGAVKGACKTWSARMECHDIPCKLLALCFSGSCTCGFCCHETPCTCSKSKTN